MNVVDNTTQRSQMSLAVCFRCKSRKKKCDKALPSCSRCTRLHVGCQYQSPTVYDLAPYSELVNYPKSNQGHPNIDADLKHEFPVTPPFIRTQIESMMASRGSIITNIDQQFTDQMFVVSNRDEENIYTSCSRYFTTIHEWYQIIVREDFLRRLENLRISANADFSSLVLNVYFLSQMYREPLRHHGELEQLYHEAKSMHFFLVSAGRASIELVQAGLLLALYEHSQALHDATYQTIGVCARMGYILGFHKTLSPSYIPIASDIEISYSQRLVWWGIIILERISTLEQLDAKFPFAIPTPLPTDLLPSHDRQLAPIGLSIDDAAAEREIPHRLNSHARLAQSIFLLSHVIEYVNATNQNSLPHNPAWLDKSIRSFMMAVLQDDLKSNHGPYTISLSALLILNQQQLAMESRHRKDDQELFLGSQAALGVRSVLRMVLDGTRDCLNLANPHTDRSPVWCSHRIFKAAILCIDLGHREMENETWKTKLIALKAILKAAEHRWKIAGKYLKDIEIAEWRLTQSHKQAVNS